MTQKQFNVGKLSDPVTFSIDGDDFEAVPANGLPVNILAKYFEKINESRIFDAQDYFFKAVLTEESAKLFFERAESVENPITITVMGDIAAWLLGEVYMTAGEDEAKE